MLLRDKLGICQWFHFEEYDEFHYTLEVLQQLGIRHFRTGISWADYHRPGGKAWYDFQMSALRDSGLDVLLSVWHTPPSISEGNHCASPPRRLQDYADFIDLIISEYSSCFSALEFWNEPNNRYKWDFETYDQHWAKFGAMVGTAAYWARQRGITTVLGGMIPVDRHWLHLMQDYGALQYMDVIGIHGFPEMWWSNSPNWDWYSHWDSWNEKITSISELAAHRHIWITETGLATCDVTTGKQSREGLQAKMLRLAADSPASRVYWYSVVDLNPNHEAIEGFHVDENEYHMGLVDWHRNPKPAFHEFQRLLHPKISGVNTEPQLRV